MALKIWVNGRYEHNCAVRSDNRVSRLWTFKPLVLMFKTTTSTISMFKTTILASLTILMFKIIKFDHQIPRKPRYEHNCAVRSDNRVTCWGASNTML